MFALDYTGGAAARTGLLLSDGAVFTLEECPPNWATAGCLNALGSFMSGPVLRLNADELSYTDRVRRGRP